MVGNRGATPNAKQREGLKRQKDKEKIGLDLERVAAVREKVNSRQVAMFLLREIYGHGGRGHRGGS